MLHRADSLIPKQLLPGGPPKTFPEQLRDPRWMELSRKKMREHPFCHSCKQGGRQLNVHHVVYHRDRMLWEYDDVDLVVLCRECHEAFHELIDQFRRGILFCNVGSVTTTTDQFLKVIRAQGPEAAYWKLKAVK